MTVPVSYTEEEIKAYMEEVLGDTAQKLGWFAADDDFDEPAREVLYTLGESDYSFVTNQATAGKVRAVARVEAWRAAMYYTAHEASYSAGAPGTGQTNRADIHRHAKAMYELVLSEMVQKYPELSSDEAQSVEMWSLEYADDYYGNAE